MIQDATESFQAVVAIVMIEIEEVLQVMQLVAVTVAHDWKGGRASSCKANEKAQMRRIAENR